MSGNEYVQAQQAINTAVDQAREILAQHGIHTVDVTRYQHHSVNLYHDTIDVVLSFESQDDCAMARMVLDHGGWL